MKMDAVANIGQHNDQKVRTHVQEETFIFYVKCC